jgi:PBP/GOBP family
MRSNSMIFFYNQIDENNKFSPEALIEVTRMVVEDDKDKMEVVEQMAEACRPTAHEDRCELSVKIMECMMEQAKARGYDPEAKKQ